ncbi:hypothetical protein ACFLV2_03155 [Chloroflexota bacterium]
MTVRILKRFFPLIAVTMLLPWPVAFAYEYNGDALLQNAVQVEAAGDDVRPGWHAFGKTIGGVTSPGDLFYIAAADCPADINVTMHIVNTGELIQSYRYMILRVGIYRQDVEGGWQPATGPDGELLPDTYITMKNGRVDFTLTGSASYKVTIESGSFNCISTSGILEPQFYLEVS